ncbi:YtzI protein [Exiguobacterium sp. MER 193]|uniref:YtzI protein n=1 Tax=unclassified Exiguobacterium TaxID=2644629 RepID=UPI001BE73F69|nr:MULTISPECIES: YtzI protein [unclassified Exiguobacterium]MCM3278910.1 YtzI protein [Exiguobacterium sp. MER 193]
MAWIFAVSGLIILLVLIASIVVIQKGYAYKDNKDDIVLDYDEINRRIEDGKKRDKTDKTEGPL